MLPLVFQELVCPIFPRNAQVMELEDKIKEAKEQATTMGATPMGPRPWGPRRVSVEQEHVQETASVQQAACFF